MQQRLRLKTQVVLLCFLALSAVACGKAASNAPSQASTSTPAPTAQSATSTAATDRADLSSLGLPVYPNVFESAWAGNLGDATQTMRQGNMSTHDDFDKVYAWYREKMPAGSEDSKIAASNHMTDDGDHAAMLQIGTTADAKSKMVMIAQNKGEATTTIVLINHTTK